MGNSRSSHNFSTSRSSSMSELPYKVDTAKSYKSKQGLRPASVASASPRQILRPKKSSAPLRSTSLTSFDDKTSRSSAVAPTRKDTKSKSPRPSSDLQPFSPRQYNDNYIQDDIKKLFKAHDKRNTKALVDEQADDSSAETLDKKLETLKKQRAKDNAATEDVKVKKSKKSKKAPSLPTTQEETTPAATSKPAAPASKEVSLDKQKTNSLLRKKSAAPPPPPVAVEKAIPEEPTRNNDTNNNKSQSADASLEITETEEKHLPPTTTTTQTTNSKSVEEVTQKPSHSETMTAHPLSDELETSTKRTVVVERELVGRSTHHKQKKAPAAPAVAKEQKQETSNYDLQIEMKDKDTFVEVITESKSEDKVVQQQEETQSASVATDMAVQCEDVLLEDKNEEVKVSEKEARVSGKETRVSEKEARVNEKEVNMDGKDAENEEPDPPTQNDNVSLVEEDTQEKEKAGNILKVFIDKNAEKDASRSADASSPEVSPVNSVLVDEEAAEKAVENDAVIHAAAVDEVASPPVQDNLHATNLSNQDVESKTEAEPSTSADISDEKVSPNITDEGGSQDDVGSNETTLRMDIDEKAEIMEKEKNNLEQNSPAIKTDSTSVIDDSIASPSTPQESTTEIAENVKSDDQTETSSETRSSPTVKPADTTASLQQEDADPDQPLTSLDINDFSKSSNWYIGKQSEPDSSSSESKKPKHKHGGIFRITKTMRKFMSSVGKANKHHKEEEADTSQMPEEEATFVSDNWMLTDKHKKPVPRKEYKPTWTEDTFTQPDLDTTNDISMKSNLDGKPNAATTAVNGSSELEEPKQEEIPETTTQATEEVELRVKPSKTAGIDSNGASQNGAESDGRTSTTAQVQRRSSALALMTPKAYGSTPSVYRPVSKLLQS